LFDRKGLKKEWKKESENKNMWIGRNKSVNKNKK
jgi:hypothetical protein